MSPNSFIKCIRSASIVIPKCENMIPTNRIPVTPNDTPATLALPSITPNDITKAKMSIEWAMPPLHIASLPQSNSLINSIENLLTEERGKPSGCCRTPYN